MADVEPVRPLTPTQEKVAALLGRGLSYPRIARELGMEPRTVEAHVRAIALLLPNPDNLTAGTLVMLWAAHREWRGQIPAR